MGSHHENWPRVSRQYPCPICGKPDNCQVSRDGQVVWCGRVSEGSLRQNAGGQFLHRLNESNRYVGMAVHPARSKPAQAQGPTRDWGAFAKYLTLNAESWIDELARALGVSYQSLLDLGVGWNASRHYWSFPEQDADGKVIGITARDHSGRKKRLYGSKSGLTYSKGWNRGDQPIFLVEGGSDTAALITIGLPVVGRPSDRAGVGILTDLLFDVPLHREIVVVGERDAKPDGRWPGKEGAVSVATQLAENLRRPMVWALPPDDAKDARAWLKGMPAVPRARLADLFISGVERTVVAPPIALAAVAPIQQHVPIDAWRDAMQQARIESLTNPGCYLDASPTGSGKSHVDINTVAFALRLEAVA